MFLGKLVSGMMMVAMVPAFALACGTKGENPSDKMMDQLKALSKSKIECSGGKGQAAQSATVSIVAKYKCMGSPVQGRLTMGKESDVITSVTKKKESKAISIVTATSSVVCLVK